MKLFLGLKFIGPICIVDKLLFQLPVTLSTEPQNYICLMFLFFCCALSEYEKEGKFVMLQEVDETSEIRGHVTMLNTLKHYQVSA